MAEPTHTRVGQNVLSGTWFTHRSGQIAYAFQVVHGLERLLDLHSEWVILRRELSALFVEVANFIIHEAHRPDVIIHLHQPYGLICKCPADVDFCSSCANPSTI